jgi:hypothetical protein
MRLGGFRDYVKYDESSFEQALNLSFEGTDVNNHILYFDVKSPEGSVMITDPTLEVVIDIAVTNPYAANGVVQYAGG